MRSAGRRRRLTQPEHGFPEGSLMQLGVVFPQTEIGADPGAVRDYAQAAGSLGCRRLVVIEHVLGAEAANHPI